MHVVIDCRFVSCSGIGRYISEVVPKILAMKGHRFTVILRPEDQETRFGRQCEGADIRRIVSTAAMYTLQEQIELPCRIPPGDVFWALHYNAPCLPVRTRRRVVTIHDMCHIARGHDMSWVKQWYARWFMYTSAHYYDTILTVSQFSKQEILKYEGIADDKVVVTGCAVDRTRYHPYRNLAQQRMVRERYGLPEDFFLFVGNVKPHKNLTTLLQAYARFQASHEAVPSLVIVGEFQKFRANGIRQDLSEHSCSSNVLFTGPIREGDLPTVYRMAHAFFFPSLYEGFGLPLLEAMACGCPVFAAHVASMPEVCGDAAQYFDPIDVADIARAMDAALLIDRGQVAKGLARARGYSWDRIAEIVWHTIGGLSY